MTDTLSLFEPRPAVESAPRAIETGVDRIQQRLRSLEGRREDVARVVQRMPGIWGEQGCAVTYRFAIQESAVLISSVRRPQGASYWSAILTIVAPPRGDVMETREESAAAAAVTFTYFTNGVIERMRWHDRRRSVTLDLDRCGRDG